MGTRRYKGTQAESLCHGANRAPAKAKPPPFANDAQDGAPAKAHRLKACATGRKGTQAESLCHRRKKAADDAARWPRGSRPNPLLGKNNSQKKNRLTNRA